MQVHLWRPDHHQWLTTLSVLHSLACDDTRPACAHYVQSSATGRWWTWRAGRSTCRTPSLPRYGLVSMCVLLSACGLGMGSLGLGLGLGIEQRAAFKPG